MLEWKAKEQQDRWVFEKVGYRGYFVDIGAYDGIECSNTYVFEKELLWNGICVEPNDISFAELKKNRKCACENICIFSKTGEVEFVQRGRRLQASGIYFDGADSHIIDKVELKNHPITIKKSMTLSDLLEKHKSPKIIDYISIDVEGAELEILSSFNFNKTTFLTMTIEHNCISGQEQREENIAKRKNIFHLLSSNGYLLDKSVSADDWYIHHSVATPFSTSASI